MRRRAALTAAIVAIAGAACDAGSRPGSGFEPGGGRVVVERIARRGADVADGPGQASYCPDDSLLLVVVLGRRWSGGLAMKVLFPLPQAQSLGVQRAVGGLGTAGAAFRPYRAGSAALGVGGTVELQPGEAATGRFDVAVPDSNGVPVVFRGRFSSVPVRVLPRGSCGT